MENKIREYKTEKNINNFKNLLNSISASFVDDYFTTDKNNNSKYYVSDLENIKKNFTNGVDIIKLSKCNKCDNEEIQKCKEYELVNKYKINNFSNKLNNDIKNTNDILAIVQERKSKIYQIWPDSDHKIQ
jgi:hypothetical protein